VYILPYTMLMYEYSVVDPKLFVIDSDPDPICSRPGPARLSKIYGSGSDNKFRSTKMLHQGSTKLPLAPALHAAKFSLGHWYRYRLHESNVIYHMRRKFLVM
jgi:hypothetical protein